MCNNLYSATNQCWLIDIPLSITLEGAQVNRLCVLINPGSKVPALLSTSITSQLGAETSAGPSLRSCLGREGYTMCDCSTISISFGHHCNLKAETKFTLADYLHYDTIIGLPFLALHGCVVD